jgi:DNA-binding SARP family transcriptional activator
MRTLSLFFRVIAAAVLVAAIALLVASRPALPPAGALSSARRIDDILIVIAWLGCLLLAAGLLYRIATGKREPAPPSTSPIRHLHPKRRVRTAMAAVYPNRAFPLVPRPRLSSPVDSAAPPACSDPEPSDSEDSGTTSPSPAIKIAVLGPLTIIGLRKHGRRMRGPTRELLAYLALHPGGAHRDQIIDALWPDQPPEQGRSRLWRAAADARHHLGETVLTRENEHYQLDRSQVSIDLAQLEVLLADLADRDDQDALLLLERALQLFGSEPLAGADLAWAENEQRRLHAVRLELLERAGKAQLAAGNPTQALAHAEKGLAQEPYNEKLARVAMQAEAELGLRTAVVSRYESLRQLLDEQLGLAPHRDTLLLYRGLLAQDGDGRRGHRVERNTA